MRRTFAKVLHDRMQKNQDIVVVSGDLGYGMFDQIRHDFPNRFFNVGAAEQTMMGVAVGLAMLGKVPIVYSITPFLLFRPAETIRNYINKEHMPVKLVASGRNWDYEHDGFSHYCGDDKEFLSQFPNITAFWPQHTADVEHFVDLMLYKKEPFYLNLKR